MQRAINVHPDGALNMLVTTNGQLIVCPRYMDQIMTANGELKVNQSGDEKLNQMYQLIVNKLLIDENT